MPDQDNNLSQYLDVLKESFKPALTSDVATHCFSTDEIYEAIKDLNPGAEIRKEDVYDAMLSAGFIFKPRRGTSGIDFRWLLIAKS